MSGRGCFFVNRERALEKQPRAGEIATVLQQKGEIVEARGRIGVLGPERLFADRQGALRGAAVRREIALGIQQRGELVEARRRIWMLRSERLFVDRERAFDERPCAGESPWACNNARRDC